jgi:hypothetical protein
VINIDTRLLAQVDGNELYLLCLIVNRLGKNSEAWPGNETLLTETGWHLEKLLKVKKRLEEKGILKVRRERGRSNRYSLGTKLIKNYYGKSVVLPIDSISNSNEGATTENPRPATVENPTVLLRKIHTLSINQELLNNEELKSDSESGKGSGYTLKNYDLLKQQFEGIIWNYIDKHDIDIEFDQFDISFDENLLRAALEKFSITELGSLLIKYIEMKFNGEELTYDHQLNHFLKKPTFYKTRFNEALKEEAETFITELISIYNSRRKLFDEKLKDTGLPTDSKTILLIEDALNYFKDKGGRQAIRNAFISFADDEIRENRYGTKKPLNYFFHRNKDTDSFEIIREHLNDYNTRYSITKSA